MNVRILIVPILTFLLMFSFVLKAFTQESITDSSNTSSESDAGILEAQEESAQVKLELENLKAEIELSNQRQNEISDEIRSLSRDTNSLNNDLIGSAEKIQELEVSIEETENQIRNLRRQEQVSKNNLASKRDVLTHVLAGLQRIGRDPPPALVVQPKDALSAVRSAILLNAVIPEIRGEASEITDELINISNLKTSIEENSSKLQTDVIKINEERVRIETLIELKKLEIANNESELNDEFLQSLKLAEKASSIEGLIAELTAEINAARKRAEQQNKAESTVANLSLTDPNRVEPSIAFYQTKGQLPLPVYGSILREFGEEDGIGGFTTGQSVVTNPNALVTSPCDGWVVFAGEFRSYGQLLILNAGSGYHVLLAGMEAINVQLGQFVLSGEPVGRMGLTQTPSAVNVALELENPILYIEFRKDDSPINPDPWWNVAELQRTFE